MSSVFKINTLKMTQEEGNVTKYCEKYGYNRQSVYQLNNKKRFNSDDQIRLADRLLKAGVGYWEEK